MVIEELHFIVAAADQADFLRIEHEVWTGFLQTCDGFVAKETWIPTDDPERIVVMIWWNSMDEWKSITEAMCDAVDSRMEEWLRPVAFFRAHDVVRSVGGVCAPGPN